MSEADVGSKEGAGTPPTTVRSFRDRLSDPATPVVGAFSVLTDPAVVEVMGVAGFDFVGVEMEHGPHSLSGLENHQRAARGCAMGTLVKLPVTDRHLLLKVLETAVDGVLLAAGEDAAAVTAAVDACRFPPLGSRGVSTIVRGAGYGSGGMSPGALADRNDALVVGVLVETPSLAAEIDIVAAHPGVDFVFVGTADLALAMAGGGTATESDLTAVIDGVIAACRRQQRPFGLPMEHPAYPRSAAQLAEMGCRVVIATSDVAAMLAGLRAVADRASALRSHGEPSPSPIAGQ